MDKWNEHPFYSELELWIDLYKAPRRRKKKRGNQLKQEDRPKKDM